MLSATRHLMSRPRRFPYPRFPITIRRIEHSMKKRKIWLIRLVPITFILICSIGFFDILYRSLVRSSTEDCWNELAMAHSAVSQDVSMHLNNSMTMLDLTSDAITTNADFEDDRAVLEYLNYVQIETVFDRIDMVFPDGTVLVSSTEERIPNRIETPYAELLARGTHLSLRVPDFLTGRESVHAFSPVYDENGQPIAILGATIYCSSMSELFHSAHYGEDAQIFLIDTRDGQIVTDKRTDTPGNIYDMKGYEVPREYEGRDFVAEIMACESGTMAYTSPSSRSLSYSIFAPVMGSHYSLIMIVQEDTIFAAVNELKDVLTWVGIIEVVFLVILAVWIYFMIRRSLETESRAREAELELLQKKEEELESQYAMASDRREFLETMALNLPGGYHRCTTDHSFRVTFMSKSFTQITGYTQEQLDEELDGSYMGIVAPMDKEYFMSLAPRLEQDRHIDCAYRIRRRDGDIRWVQDTTQYVERDGEQYYQCALMDITVQIEELERARLEAEASSRAKSTFLFNISHDIRTPMNAIKGFSHIIEKNADDPAKVRQTLGKLDQASDALMMLVNDVLDLSRIERGKEELTLQPLDLYELGQSLYEMFAGDMKTAGIHFEGAGESLDGLVLCDRLKLTRILMNMLSNAKKFTPAGGHVTFGGTRLHVDEQSCTYRFFVRDTGIGMSPEFLQKAFEQFERERTSTESGVTGSGLGLAIIKMLVELMGGTVDIQSRLGEGTEISATLTLAFASAEKKETSDAAPEVTLDPRGMRILLVEDNEFNREIATYILENMQFTVDSAENGAICLEKLTEAAPDFYDLVLMDLQMPVMDGYTAASEIRKLTDPRLSGIPIIAMTANAFEEDKKRCLEIGMNGHIGKPIDLAELTEALTRTLT